jgi:hypothetical protein
VHVGCIKPLCDLLDVNEVKIIKVAMEGLENILKVTALPWTIALPCVPDEGYAPAWLHMRTFPLMPSTW